MKFTIALALVASSASAWEIPDDAYSQFPMENGDLRGTKGVDNGRKLWWEPPKEMMECFDYDKCKECWTEDCQEEADDAYSACRKWDAFETKWAMERDDECGDKLDPDKPGDAGLCGNYGKCIYEDCGYACGNVSMSSAIALFDIAMHCIACPISESGTKFAHLIILWPFLLSFTLFSTLDSARDLTVTTPTTPTSPARMMTLTTVRMIARNAGSIAVMNTTDA